MAAGKLVGVVGGDHSVPFGAIRAAAEAHPGMGVLHLDAHADLRDAYEGFRWSHASIMFNVLRDLPAVARIVQVGIRDYSDDEDALMNANPGRLVTFFDPDLRRQLFDGEPWSRITHRIAAALPREVYLSFDIDGLDPALCPHTGTPVLGGLSFPEVSALLRAVVETGRRIVGLDLSEVAPDPGGLGVGRQRRRAPPLQADRVRAAVASGRAIERGGASRRPRSRLRSPSSGSGARARRRGRRPSGRASAAHRGRTCRLRSRR